MSTAFEIPNNRFALEAGGIIARRRFVTVDSNGAGVQATAGVTVIGVSMNDTKLGETLEIADGIVMVEAATAIAAGVDIASDANGKAVVLPAVNISLTIDAQTITIPASTITLTGEAETVTIPASTVSLTADTETITVPVPARVGKAITSAGAPGELISVKI